jgi:hypothetical protein
VAVLELWILLLPVELLFELIVLVLLELVKVREDIVDEVDRREPFTEGWGSCSCWGASATGCSSVSITSVTGDDGTGGRLRFVGRSFILGLGLGGRLKPARTAVAGGGGIENEVFHTGAEGGGRDADAAVAALRRGRPISDETFRGVPVLSSSGEEVADDSSV